MVMGNTVVEALGQSASPRLAKYCMENDQAAFRALLFKVAGISVLLGGSGVLAALLGGREILTILYSPEYAEHAEIFLWLTVAAAISYPNSPLNYGLVALRQLPLQSLLNAANTVLVCGLSFMLIPRMGMLGAVIIFGVSSALLIVLKVGVVERQFRSQSGELPVSPSA